MNAKRVIPILAVLAMLAGCNQYGYRYKPLSAQMFDPPYFADYRQQANTVDLLLDTHGRKLQTIQITNRDGSIVKPIGIDYPAFVARPVGGTATPIAGPERADGPTVAHFDKAAIGPQPWTIQAKLEGASPLVFRVGG
jgi:hypothetical protein